MEVVSSQDLQLALRSPARALVNLAAVRHNVRILQATAGDLDAKIMAVVKADAYGHGAPRMAEAIAQCGVRAFAVATLGEAVELRRVFENLETERGAAPRSILVLGAPLQEDVPFLVHYRLDAMITSLEVATNTVAALSATDGPGAPRLRVHLCIETGMTRVGLLPDQVPEVDNTL